VCEALQKKIWLWTYVDCIGIVSYLHAREIMYNVVIFLGVELAIMDKLIDLTKCLKHYWALMQTIIMAKAECQYEVHYLNRRSPAPSTNNHLRNMQDT
jgi:hypothetical protein